MKLCKFQDLTPLSFEKIAIWIIRYSCTGGRVSRELTGVKNKEEVFWGWYVVSGSFSIMVVTYGVRYSFGVFVKPMLAEYGWSMTIIQMGSSINLFMYAITGVFTGWLLDRIAPKWIIIAGILVTSSGLFLASYIKTPLGLYISYGVLVGTGSAGCGMVVCSAAVGKWFDRHRGVALGISSMGIGVGTMLMAPFAAYIVKHYSWQSGFLSIGFMMLVTGVFISCVFMGKKSPVQAGALSDVEELGKDGNYATITAKPEEKASLKPVLKTMQFWILVFCNVGAMMTVMMTFNLQIAYAINNGISALEAAAALGVIGITGSLGKLFFGWLSDRTIDAKYLALSGYIIMAAGIFVLYKAESSTMLYVFALIYGFGYGSLAPLVPGLISNLFGSQLLGVTFGLVIFFTFGLGGTAGPVLGGYIYDRTGSYDLVWQICMATLLLVSVVILFLKPTNLRFNKAIVKKDEDPFRQHITG